MPLSDRDTYRTPPRPPRSRLARISPWPELAFYPSMLRIVFWSSRLARQGRYGDDQWVEASRRTRQALEAVGVRFVVEGLEHLWGLSGPAVFVGNHMSTLETFVLPSLIQPIRPVTFVVKKSLLTYPVFGPVMRARNPVAVGRTNPREDLKAVLEGGQERLGRGISLIVFPQTTRTPIFDPEQFNSIGAKLAARAGVPLVPLALKTDAWGNGRLLKDFGRVNPSLPVHFRFGAPMAAEGKGASAQEATVRFIREALAEWETEVVRR